MLQKLIPGILGLIVALVVGLMTPVRAHALLFDINGFFYSDSIGSPADFKTSRYNGDVALALALDQDKMINLGFAVYSAQVENDDDGAKSRWTTFDYGIKLVGFFNRTKEWGAGLSYFPFASGKYEFSDGTSETMRGTSVHVNVGYVPLIAFGLYFGIRLNYYSATYKEYTIDGSTYLPQTVQVSSVYPSLFLSVRY